MKYAISWNAVLRCLNVPNLLRGITSHAVRTLSMSIGLQQTVNRTTTATSIFTTYIRNKECIRLTVITFTNSFSVKKFPSNLITIRKIEFKQYKFHNKWNCGEKFKRIEWKILLSIYTSKKNDLNWTLE